MTLSKLARTYCRECRYGNDELGGLRPSLAESGKCHIAYDPSFYEQDVLASDSTPNGRFIEGGLHQRS